MGYNIVENPQGVLIISTTGPGNSILLQDNTQVQGHYLNGTLPGAAAPSVNYGANNGSAVVPRLVNASDTAGQVIYSTQTGLGAGSLVFVNFGFPYATAPNVMITENNPSTSGANTYVTSSTTGFAIFHALAPAVGTYSCFYWIVG